MTDEKETSRPGERDPEIVRRTIVRNGELLVRDEIRMVLVSLRIPRPLKEDLEAIAAEELTPTSTVIRRILYKYVRRWRKRKSAEEGEGPPRRRRRARGDDQEQDEQRAAGTEETGAPHERNDEIAQQESN